EQGFACAVEEQRLTDMIQRRTRLRGWEDWASPLCQWLTQLVSTPLPLPTAPPLALEDIHGYQVELEFWLASHNVDTRRLDDLVSANLLPGHPRPRLEADTLNGMLKGFIDL